MNFFNFDLRKALAIVFILAIPLIAINMEHNPSKPQWFGRPFIASTGLIQNMYSGFSSGVRGTTSLYLNLVDIKTNNRLLQKENDELRAQLGTLNELTLENQRLNTLLSFKENTKMELLAAKVIGKDLLPEHSTLTINKGTQHGIKEYMAVITVGGVVGYIIQPQSYTSQILLITDRYASIDSIVQRSRARGIVEGLTEKTCSLNYLEREDDVVEGDVIVTSGFNNIFPKGFIIGSVIEVKKDKYEISQHVKIKPSVNALTLEEVFVVLNTHEEDFLPPIQTENKSQTKDNLPPSGNQKKSTTQ